MSKRVTYVVCPLCGLNRVLEKKGSRAILEHKPLDMKLPGQIIFNAIDVTVDPFEDLREAVGGTTGFKRVETHSLLEIVQKGQYPELREQLKGQCESILSVLGALRYQQQEGRIFRESPESGLLAHQEEHLPDKQEAVGSNPTQPTKTLTKKPIEPPKTVKPTQSTTNAISGDYTALKGHFKPIIERTKINNYGFRDSFADATIRLADGRALSTTGVDLDLLYMDILAELPGMIKKSTFSR